MVLHEDRGVVSGVWSKEFRDSDSSRRPSSYELNVEVATPLNRRSCTIRCRKVTSSDDSINYRPLLADSPEGYVADVYVVVAGGLRGGEVTTRGARDGSRRASS